MRTLLAIVLLLLLIPPALRAAEVSTRAGTTAMIFKFEGLSNVGLEGPNGGLGLRTYAGDRLALRSILSFAWSRRRVRAPAPPPGQPPSSDQMKIDTSVQLELALEKHLEGPAGFSPYLGLGLYGTHYDFKMEPSVLQGSPPGTLTKTTDRGTNGSLFASLGFEWGCAESLTLGGETRFGVNVDTGKRETERIRTPDRLSNDTVLYRVGFETVSVFLAVRL